jgi:hypothetical protein
MCAKNDPTLGYPLGCNHLFEFHQSKETLIKCLATANAADLPHNFGKNAQNTTSIPALFACSMHQSHRRSQRQALISVSLKSTLKFSPLLDNRG